MTYRVKASIKGPGAAPIRVITTCLTGCTDEAHAKEKLRTMFHVVKVDWVKPAD